MGHISISMPAAGRSGGNGGVETPVSIFKLGVLRNVLTPGRQVAGKDPKFSLGANGIDFVGFIG
jgi:hypothetical protein